MEEKRDEINLNSKLFQDLDTSSTNKIRWERV